MRLRALWKWRNCTFCKAEATRVIFTSNDTKSYGAFTPDELPYVDEKLSIYFETKQEAFEEFQRAYAGSPIQDSLTVEQMQESFRVKLKNPEEYEGVVSSVVGLKGVQKVQDLRQYLDPFFNALNFVQWGTIAASALLLVEGASMTM